LSRWGFCGIWGLSRWGFCGIWGLSRWGFMLLWLIFVKNIFFRNIL
jgi:hypothetical protein